MFSTLERNILMTKGVTAQQLEQLQAAGVSCKADFATVGTAPTLVALVDMPTEVATLVMQWAQGTAPTATADGGKLVVESADAVYCVHCRAKQPKDYSSGDLCGACGKQAEPTRACFWCGTSGPGQFCRGCGARFVPTGELELAALLKRDGLPKDDIPARLAGLNAADKDALWARVRR